MGNYHMLCSVSVVNYEIVVDVSVWSVVVHEGVRILIFFWAVHVHIIVYVNHQPINSSHVDNALRRLNPTHPQVN